LAKSSGSNGAGLRSPRHADQLHRNAELLAIASAIRPFRPVELRERDPRDVDSVAEQQRLAQAILAGRRVDREQRLVRRARQLLSITRYTSRARP